MYNGLGNGGAERVITTVANELSKKNDVTICLWGTKEPPFYEVAPSVKLIYLDIIKISANKGQGIKNWILRFIRVKQYFKEYQPDIVCAFSMEMAVLCKIICGGKIKVIGSERANPLYKNSGIKDHLVMKMTRWLDGTIFQTTGAQACYPLKLQKKSCVIPNAIFANIDYKNLPEYGNRQPYTICATGRLEKVKRYDILIDAIEIVIKYNPNVKLDIYGGGSLQKLLEEKVLKQNLGNHVMFHGRVKDLIKEISTHRIFVLSSDAEGMPNGLIEAMACGLACIATDCKFGPRDLIENHKNGILIPTGDVNNLANQLQYVLENDDFSQRLSQNATSIRNDLAKSVIVQKYYEYFKKIVF